jgi:glycosyltransferase involved in cell wall biosynthesis
MLSHPKYKGKTLLDVMPKLSIICVAFNPKEDARVTLESIAKLTYTNKEVILIDNCSDLESQRIYEEYASIINEYLSEPDEGIYDAMNKGVKLASGDWIWFMNMGDAFASSNVVERIFSKIVSSKIKVIYGDTLVENGELKYIKRHYASIERNFKNGILHLNHQSVLVQKEVFQKIGRFFHKKYPLRADMHHLTRAYFEYLASAFFHVEFVLAIFQENGVSSMPENVMKMFDEDIEMQREFHTRFNIPKLYWQKWYAYYKIKGLSILKRSSFLYKMYRKVKYYFVTKIEQLS